MNKVARRIVRAVIPALCVTGLLALVLPFVGPGLERRGILFVTFGALTITLMVFGLPVAGGRRPPAE